MCECDKQNVCEVYVWVPWCLKAMQDKMMVEDTCKSFNTLHVKFCFWVLDCIARCKKVAKKEEG